MPGNLYIVSTPIGNLDDLTVRAIRVLGDVDIIFAESGERTQKLLSHYDIKKKAYSFNKDNEKRKVENVVDYLNKSCDVALVTDAGTPSISDPGFFLLTKTPDTIKVIPIPGASSLSCALSVSRIPMNSFIFLGFLSKNDSDRKKKLLEVSESKLPVCLFESKHRLVELFKSISEIFGADTKIGLFKEMTKIYETVVHKKVNELLLEFKSNKPKGEFVIIIEPKQDTLIEKSYTTVIKDLILKEYSNKDIVDIIRLFSQDTKKEIYKNVLTIRQNA